MPVITDSVSLLKGDPTFCGPQTKLVEVNLEELETTYPDFTDNELFIVYGDTGMPELRLIQWDTWNGPDDYLKDPFVEVVYPADSEPVVKVESHEFFYGLVHPFFRHKLAYKVKFDHLPDVAAHDAPFEAITMPPCTHRLKRLFSVERLP